MNELVKVVFFIKESKRHLGSLSSLGGIGVMVKEITGDEENDRQDDDDSMSGKSSDIHNRLSLYHCDVHCL